MKKKKFDIKCISERVDKTINELIFLINWYNKLIII